jgi:serine/threonine-protein kinase 24/25/MST4
LSSWALLFLIYYSQGTVRKAAGWDFPDRSEGTGTVRGGLRPPQITSTKDGRFDMPQNPSTLKRTADRENQWRTSGTGSEESSSTNMSKKEAQTDHGRLESSTEYVRFPSTRAICKLLING